MCDVRMLNGSQNYKDELSTVNIVEQKQSIDLTNQFFNTHFMESLLTGNLESIG